MEQSLFFVCLSRRERDGLTQDFLVFCIKLLRLLRLTMQKRRVLLICSQNLFGESLEAVLRAAQARAAGVALPPDFRTRWTIEHSKAIDL